MTQFQPIRADDREVAEIDALVRALASLRHWSATTQARRLHGCERGERLFANALQWRDEAWADALAAAYRLFEIDAIHEQWIDCAGARHVG